jgi:CDGSH-type Zn-finger protein
MKFVNAGDLDKPALVTLEAGSYFWCRCGQTQTPPFCDNPRDRANATAIRSGQRRPSPLHVCLSTTPVL